MELIKEDEKGRTYQAKGITILYRNAGSITGDNEINDHEIIYFISGSAIITLKERTWTIESPAKVEFPANTYHKIESITNVSFVIVEN